MTHLKCVQTASHITSRQFDERGEYPGIGGQLLSVADLAQAGNNELSWRLAEADDARELSQRTQCWCVQVVTNADDWASERLGRLVPLLLCGHVLDELDEASDKALGGQLCNHPS
jgi:hypothetical protein